MQIARPRRLIATALAISAVGLVAGCGNSGESSAGSSGGTTGSDFVAQANGICTAATEEFNALGNTQEYEDLADFKDRFGQAMAIAKQQYEDIAALTPPADIAADVKTYLDEGAASVKMTQELYDRVVAGEDIAAAEAATLGTPDGQATIKARREAATNAGLEACAS